MNETNLKPMRGRKATFGIIAVACFFVGLGLCAFGVVLLAENIGAWAALIGATQGKADGWWADSIGGATYAMFGGLIVWGVGLVFGGVGLKWAERPRWPAIVGLTLCTIPTALVLFALVADWIQPK